MSARFQQERLAERRVTYTLELDGKLYVVENVPARVDLDTGEQLFAPETVEQLQIEVEVEVEVEADPQPQP